jgi:hypothetical protein
MTEPTPLFDLTVQEHMLPLWAARIEERLITMSANQDRIAQLAQQFNDMLTSIEAEIQGLKNQPAAETLDWAPLEAVLARGVGDEPANPPAAAEDNSDGPVVTETAASPLG